MIRRLGFVRFEFWTLKVVLNERKKITRFVTKENHDFRDKTTTTIRDDFANWRYCHAFFFVFLSFLSRVLSRIVAVFFSWNFSK